MGRWRSLRNVPDWTQKENRAHGDEQFPFAFYKVRRGPGEPVVDIHWHPEFEFLWVLEGAALWQTGTETFPLRAGEAVFVHGGEIHAGFPLEGGGCTFAAAVFHPDLLRSGVRDAVFDEHLLRLRDGDRTLPKLYRDESPWGKEVLAHLKAVGEAMERGADGHEMAVKGRLYLIFSIIAENRLWIARPRAGPSDADKFAALKTVLAHIARSYGQKIKIGELAAMISMSEGHFCRYFKSLVHQTPVQYINAWRIGKAVELLETTDRKVIDIALETGFDNPSYFIRKFREQMHCTPSEYRKRRRRL